MNDWALFLGMLLSLAAAGIVIWDRWRTRKTMDVISQMLTDAMSGGFTEDRYEESRLSALEEKFARYLSSSTVLAGNLAVEKDRIKTLIADISHQTKTPIANLLLYSELLREEELPDSAKANAEAVYAQAEKLRFLIDALVKLSRLENGIITLSPRAEKIQETLERVVAEHALAAQEKRLTLRLFDTEASAVFDPKWTAEALGNLVDNAIKYTEQGSVTISAVSYELFTRIDVADTGIGIPEAESASVFSRFYRSERVKDREGVGIGLYLARKIIADQGGYIKLSSTPGEGAVFSVFLPRQP